MRHNDPTLNNSVRRFVKLYKRHRLIQDTYVRPAVTSFLQTCDKDAGRVNNNGYRRGGKRIRVQVTSALRRRKGLSRGLRKVQQERPKKNLLINKAKVEELDRFIMPSRK